MNKQHLGQCLASAIAIYYDVLCLVHEMLRRYGTTLSLMVPGFAEQLAINNGVSVTANGVPLFYVIVRRCGASNLSPMAFGKAVQEALDATCYANCCDRLRLLRVEQGPSGLIALTLTIGG